MLLNAAHLQQDVAVVHDAVLLVIRAARRKGHLALIIEFVKAGVAEGGQRGEARPRRDGDGGQLTAAAEGSGPYLGHGLRQGKLRDPGAVERQAAHRLQIAARRKGDGGKVAGKAALANARDAGRDGDVRQIAGAEGAVRQILQALRQGDGRAAHLEKRTAADAHHGVALPAVADAGRDAHCAAV